MKVDFLSGLQGLRKEEKQGLQARDAQSSTDRIVIVRKDLQGLGWCFTKS